MKSESKVRAKLLDLRARRIEVTEAQRNQLLKLRVAEELDRLDLTDIDARISVLIWVLGEDPL